MGLLAAPAAPPRHTRTDVAIGLLLAVFAGLLLLPRLGEYPLLASWEPHYAQVAREMLARDNWWDPVYRGGRFWSKPIGEFWLVIPSFKIFGVSDFAARLPNAIIGILGVALAYSLTRRLFSRRAGVLTALVLATAPFYQFVSRQLMVDVPYVVFYFAAMGYFALAFFKEYRLRYVLYGWSFLGLVMLFKGLLAVVLPGAIFFVYVFATWDWSVVRKIKLHLGLPVFLLVAGPWYGYMIYKHGSPFAREWFIEHHFQRMAGDLDKPNDTFELYFRDLAYGFFPWIALLPAGLVHFVRRWRAERRDLGRAVLLVLLAAVVPYLVFSYAQTKFHHYIFPVIPFAALLVGVFLDRVIAQAEDGRQHRLLLVLAALLVLVVAKDLVTGMNYKYLIHLFTVHRVQDWFGPLGDPRMLIGVAGGLLALLLVALAIRPAARGRLPSGLVGGLLLGGLGLALATSLELSVAARAGIGAAGLGLGAASGVLLQPTVGGLGLAGLVLAPALICGHLNFHTVPDMLWCFSARPLVEQYLAQKQGSEPLATYNSWKTRDTTYYLPLHYRWTKTEQDVELARFVRRHKNKRYFIEVPKRHYGRLREVIRETTGENVYIVADDRFEGFVDVRLVSNRRGSAGAAQPGEDLLERAPEGLRRVDVDLGGKVRLLGYSLSADEIAPGGTLVVTQIYEVLQPVGGDYMVFIHADRVNQPFRRALSDHVPAGGRHPTTDWQPGQIVKDVCHLNFAAGWPPGEVTIYAGLFRGNERLPAAEAGKHDGHNRVILTTIEVE